MCQPVAVSLIHVHEARLGSAGNVLTVSIWRHEWRIPERSLRHLVFFIMSMVRIMKKKREGVLGPNAVMN